MHELRELLQEIKSGKISFTPRSSAEVDMVEFQAVAKTLVFADGQGYLDGFLPHRESSTRHSWYDCVIIKNGLSYQGEEFLKTPAETETFDAMKSTSPSDSRAVPARAVRSINEHLRVLEVASWNDAAPHHRSHQFHFISSGKRTDRRRASFGSIRAIDKRRLHSRIGDHSLRPPVLGRTEETAWTCRRQEQGCSASRLIRIA